MVTITANPQVADEMFSQIKLSHMGTATKSPYLEELYILFFIILRDVLCLCQLNYHKCTGANASIIPALRHLLISVDYFLGLQSSNWQMHSLRGKKDFLLTSMG